ncbi:hypothetical protein CFP71_19630 [Amycolatopsis thailandensis]|uniref:Uncharacterized protein n=1 Tax=Amycolatopsis thailandensis TaxID=589330 RepID=A0A229S6Z0_9PSEU|nr:hypothetical protein [Amycolatopsis thailandensis]OXM54585.1 hypothetical protein CFP71_19630 [Amycolatopsis thailandensis]
MTTTPFAPDSEAAFARARRKYLIAMSLGPIALVAVCVVSFAGPRNRSSILPVLGLLAFALILFLIGYARRDSPVRWNRVAAISGVVAGVYGAVVVLGWREAENRLLIAIAVLVVLSLVPWLAVRNASASVLARPNGALAGATAELSFALRDEADGWFLIREDEVAVRIRRKVRRNLDDDHDAVVSFSGIAGIEVIDLPGDDEVEIGLSYAITPSAGPALRVLVDDKEIDLRDEWIVPIDEARQAAEALRSRKGIA